jgi:hypothetical protein
MSDGCGTIMAVKRLNRPHARLYARPCGGERCNCAHDSWTALSSLEAQHTFEVFEGKSAVLFLVVNHVIHLGAQSNHEQIKDDHCDNGDGDGCECYLYIRPIFANLRQRAPEGKPS